MNIQIKLQQLDKSISALENRLKSCPEGSLCVSQTHGKYFTYRHYLPNGSVRLLKKNERDFAKKLALKKYYEHKLFDLRSYREELLKIKQLSVEQSTLQYFQDNPGIAKLLKGLSFIENEDLRKWATSPTATSSPHQEQRTIKTLSGVMVRSKTEGMILDNAFMRNIPAQYDYPMKFGDIKLHMDVVLRDPQTGIYIPWDHCGMLDNPQYSNHMCKKMKLYAEHGYVPFRNMIMTFESSAYPIDSSLIDTIFDIFF